jgi:hypothetical protein
MWILLSLDNTTHLRKNHVPFPASMSVSSYILYLSRLTDTQKLALYDIRYTPFGNTIVMRQWQAIERYGIPDSTLCVDFAHAHDPTGPRISPMPFSIRDSSTCEFVPEQYAMVKLHITARMYTVNVRSDVWKDVGDVCYYKPTVTVDVEKLRRFCPNI